MFYKSIICYLTQTILDYIKIRPAILTCYFGGHFLAQLKLEQNNSFSSNENVSLIVWINLSKCSQNYWLNEDAARLVQGTSKRSSPTNLI